MAEAELNEAKKLLAEAETRERAARLRAVSLRSMKFIADNGIRRSATASGSRTWSTRQW